MSNGKHKYVPLWRNPFVWVAAWGAAFLLIVGYMNLSVNIVAKEGVQYNHKTFEETWMVDRTDAAFCKARDHLLETSEMNSTVKGLEYRHFRVKNLLVMSDPKHIEDSVLIVVVYNDAGSWARGRSVGDFLNIVKSFDYPSRKISLGLLTSSPSEYEKLKTIILHELLSMDSFAQVSITLRQDFSIALSRGDRKGDDVQKERRRMIARYRNYALSQSLESWHSHVVWIDSDIVEIPSYLLTKMVQADRDILEPLCHLKGRDGFDYDLNAWQGNRKSPNPEELQAMHNGKNFNSGPEGGTKHINDMRDHEYHELDSVGGTMLYVKADIHRQGVMFATHYVIGSEWKYEGYDGIETEGLCYVAGMLGYKCYAMPKDIIYHAPDE